QYQRANFLAAGLLQHVDGGDHGAAGCQHGVDDHRQTLVEIVHQALQVGMGLQGFFVAGDADRADFRSGNEVEHAVEHADTRPQDRNHGDLLAGDLLDLNRSAPALDAVVLQWQVAGGFIGQDRSHFLSQFAKVLGADIGSAHQAEFVSDQRVADLSNGHGWLRRAYKPA